MQKAKEYLKSIRLMQANIEERAQTVQELQCEYAKMTANYSGMPRSGNTSDISDILSRLESCVSELNTLIFQKLEKIEKISKEIQALDNSDYETLLFAYYVNRKSMKSVSKIMNYSIRHTLRLHEQALRAFEKNMA